MPGSAFAIASVWKNNYAMIMKISPIFNKEIKIFTWQFYFYSNLLTEFYSNFGRTVIGQFFNELYSNFGFTGCGSLYSFPMLRA